MDVTGISSTDIPPDCAKYVRTYATGLRNSYDFVWHSSGNLWATDNALGVTGNFPILPPGWKQGKQQPVNMFDSSQVIHALLASSLMMILGLIIPAIAQTCC